MVLGFRRPPSFGRLRNFAQAVHAFLAGGMGVLSLATFLLFGRIERPQALPPLVVFLVGALLSVAVVVLALVLPALARSERGAPVSVRLLREVYGRIVLAAALEGAGLFWAVAALFMGEAACFLGTALALAALLFSFPTTRRLERAVGLDEEEIDRALVAEGGTL